MKKLFKHEWKYYVFFTIVVTVILIINESPDFDLVYGENIPDIIGWGLRIFLSGINGNLLGSSVLTVLIGILAFKAAFFWLERDSYGREFFQTLPVTRIDRIIFHLVMDSLVILTSVTASTVYLYCYSVNKWEEMEIEIPGLAASIFGEMFISIGYLLFLLCLINVLECLFADGFTRIVATAGSIFIGYWFFYFVFLLNETNKWIQKLYSFFILESWCFDYAGTENGLVQETMNTTIYYKGNPLVVKYGFTEYLFFKFTDMESYIGRLIGYVLLAVILACIAICLAGRQENSKKNFYFAFGRYMISALISGTFCTMTLLEAETAWYEGLIILASVLLFSILAYWMDSDRKTFRKKKCNVTGEP